MPSIFIPFHWQKTIEHANTCHRPYRYFINEEVRKKLDWPIVTQNNKSSSAGVGAREPRLRGRIPNFSSYRCNGKTEVTRAETLIAELLPLSWQFDCSIDFFPKSFISKTLTRSRRSAREVGQRASNLHSSISSKDAFPLYPAPEPKLQFRRGKNKQTTHTKLQFRRGKNKHTPKNNNN